MKRLLPLTALTLSTAFTLFQTVVSGPATAAQLFQAILDSDQEVAPAGATNSPATGFATLELNDAGTELTYSMTFFGIDFSNIAPVPSPTNPLDTATRLHFHQAPRGANGPVVFGIFDPDQDLNDRSVTFNPVDESTTVSGIWDLGDPANVSLDNFVPGLLATAPGEDTELYLNLHSVNDGSGIIRGQVIAVPVPESQSLTILGSTIVLGFGALFKKKNLK